MRPARADALGLVAYVYPFAGSEWIRLSFSAYWLFYLVPYLILTMPALLGRCDIYPALTTWERFRWYIEEAALQVLLLTRSVDGADPADICGPLGWW